ncbi:MAG TPA: phosphoribosylformylglycinamidine synthase subunit PurL [Actinomycetota bacterium]
MSIEARTRRDVHRELGLTNDEHAAIVERLGREPTFTELAMFSVMWSEHCSYKSSRVHLSKMPSEGAHILVGPGEGAGVIEVAPGVAVAWKAESHNHPSFVEPFNGAATGVGGIVRDILSMGARPIALMDPLRFGPLDDARTRYLVDGVVHGISSYGNSIGVPTVGGETVFEDCYAANPLVNVACLGVITGPLAHGRAEGPGNAVVLIGSSTGRDGIGGASVLASAEFDDASMEKRPSVQVGDPFSEKLLIEACLELLKSDLVVGIQDLGAGGIACPTSEMSAKAGTGMRVHVENVHRREPGMEPFEVMISESQERMMAVVEPARVDQVLAVCARWGLDANVIGEVTSTGRLEVMHEGERVADVPVDALAEDGPVYDRPLARPQWIEDLHARSPGDDAPGDLEKSLLALLGSPEIASKRWVWEQYDHMIFLGTVQGPGGDAAVVRLPDSDVGVAITVDGPGRLCYLDPYEGAKLAVAEAARNVACTGARPLAITNCLNFGNPEKPDVMWQFAEVVRGISDACRAFDTPVTGGNVSFYNETNGRAIYPTPVIGMLGSIDPAARAVGLALCNEGDVIYVLGETRDDDFGGSDYAKVVNGVVAGRPPRLDLDAEARLHRLLVDAAGRALLKSAHDASGGGLGVALAESALAGSIGFTVEVPGAEPHRWLYSESPSRAVVSVAAEQADELEAAAAAAGVPAYRAGVVGGGELHFGVVRIPLSVAAEAHEGGFAAALSVTIDG